MASDMHMPGPLCLIENTSTQLVVNPEALKILSAITQPVVVVAIVGLYRTGKSYLMNKLAGQKNGFSLGFTAQSHTKGIWMWCVCHPKKPNYTLVLLDTEGLENVEKGNHQNDSWVFALAILLSSTFVYNSMGTINEQAMDQMLYVTELTDKITAKSSPYANGFEDSADFVRFFPDFVWTLRDFSLELKVDGQPTSADEYLQNSLKLKEGTISKDRYFNLPRLYIQKSFPKKKCFIFDQPTHGKKLGQLETMHDDELDPKFMRQVADFCSYIFTNSKVKTLSGGIQVDGPRMATMVLTYVDAISSGDLPCMENAVLALAKIENSAAMEKAIAHYDQQIGEEVEVPTKSHKLMDLLIAIRDEAIEVFIKNSFNDVDHLFQRKLEGQLGERLFKLYEENGKVLNDYYDAIHHPIYEDQKKGFYSKPGGFKLMFENMVKMEDHLPETFEKIESEKIDQIYQMVKESGTNTILQTEENLTEKGKEIEEAAAKMLEEMQKKYQQMMDEKEKSYQEHVKQLTEKMEVMRVLYRAAVGSTQDFIFKLLKERRQLQREIETFKNNRARSEDHCILM